MIIPMLKGLLLTFNRFFSRPITIQYPEEKMPAAPRWRGFSILKGMNRERRNVLPVAFA